MKQSEVRQLGKEIINQIFPAVICSNQKEDWQKAFDFLHKKITELEIKAGQPEATNHNIRELWAFNSCRRQLCERYGRKFIKPQFSKK